MYIVVRNEENLSLKTNYIVKLAIQAFGIDVFYIFKKESNKFSEKWYNDKLLLRSSDKAIIFSFLLTLLKSPKDFRNGLMYRLLSKKRENTLTGHGFLSTLSGAMHLQYGTSAQADSLFIFLNKMKTSKLFLIDEFLSLNCLDIKKLETLGSIIYVSQDTAFNRFGYGDNIVTKKLMFQLEHNALAYVDLVIACSEMERLKYLRMGAKKAIFYPNMYPTKGFTVSGIDKDEVPSISIVLRSHWGSKAEKSLDSVFNALGLIDERIRVYMVGIKPKKVPKNITIVCQNFIPTKLEYLKLLSKSWIGINLGIHIAGTNERKYDYAEAGLVVFSDSVGAGVTCFRMNMLMLTLLIWQQK